MIQDTIIEGQKLTNEEIARVFAMYLGCEVVGRHEKLKGKLTAVQDYGNIKIKLHEAPVVNTINDSIMLSRLCLNSLKELSEYQMSILDQINPSLFFDYDEMYKGYQNIKSGDISFLTYNQVQQLVIYEYAIPLYIDNNHWANGKTAIELGIAIDNTTQSKEQVTQ